MALCMAWGHAIITFALRGRGDPLKCEHMRTEGGGVTSMRTLHINFV